MSWCFTCSTKPRDDEYIACRSSGHDVSESVAVIVVDENTPLFKIPRRADYDYSDVDMLLDDDTIVQVWPETTTGDKT